MSGNDFTKEYVTAMLNAAMQSVGAAPNPVEFQQLANGFFQAEGCLTASIRGTNIQPNISVGQNLNEGSLRFFVQLWHALGQVGTLSINLTMSNTWHITYRSNSWSHILGTCASYFNCLYGEKYIAFAKLAMIHTLLHLKDAVSQSEMVKLVYSLALYGTSRLLTLEQQLLAYGLPYNGDSNPTANFLDNQLVPSFLFIVGFMLGDGTYFVRLRRLDIGSLNIVPILFMPQKTTILNNHFFKLIMQALSALGINSHFRDIGNGKSRVMVEGVNAVFAFLTLLAQYPQYWFWKTPDIQLMMGVWKYMSSGIHLTRIGIIFIINYIYSFASGRFKDAAAHIDAMNAYFNTLDSESLSGEQLVQPLNDRNTGAFIAWRVVFPARFLPKQKIRSFSLHKYKTFDAALAAATAHRDYVINARIKELSDELN